MKPIKLVMNAFGSFLEKTEIDFTVLNNAGFYLITGATGSGKTTIFDAIMFALYGEASGDTRTTEGFRSDFAEDKNPTYVEFTFEKDNIIYKVTRSPRYTVSYRTTPIDSKASIEYEKKVIEKTNFVNETINDILGLTASQFKQVIMLAQGEFMKLIHAKSSERDEIFRKIFGTEVFEKVSRLLKEETKEVKEKIKLKEELIKRIIINIPSAKEYENYNATILDTNNTIYLINELETKIINAKKQMEEYETNLTTLSKELIDLGSRKETAKLINEDFNNLKIEQEKLQLLDEQNNNIIAKESRINILNEVSKIKTVYEKLININLQVKMLSKTYETNKAILEEKQETLNFFIDQTNMIELDRLSLENLKKTKSEIEKNINVKKEIESKLTLITSIEQEIININKEIDALLKEQVAILKQLDDLNKQINDLTKYKLEYEVVLKEIESLNGVIKEFNKNHVLYEELIKINSNLEGLACTYQNLLADYNCAHNNYLKLEQKYFSNIAGVLAKDLHENTPCPVCGSTSHPNVASIHLDLISKETLDKEYENVELIRVKKDEKLVEIETLKTQYSICLKQLLENLNITDALEIERKLEEVSNTYQNRLKELNNYKETCISSLNKLETLEQTFNETTNKLNTTESSITKYKEELIKINNSLSTINGAISTLESQLTFSNPIEELELALEERVQGIMMLDEAITGFDKEYNLAKEEHQLIKGKVEENINQLEILKVDQDAIIKEYNKILKKTSLSKDIIDNIEIYITDLVNLASYVEEVTEYHTKYKACKKTIEELNNKLKDKEIVDLTEIEKLLDEKNKEIDLLKEQINTLMITIDKQKTSFKELTKLFNDYVSLTSLYEDVSLMSLAANGQNKKYLSFERYVLTEYFDNILNHANYRLKKMTNGRYLLYRKVDKSKGRAQQGLDMEIFDFETGKRRDVKTLSGGETFKAALSLALGLADAIENKVGNITIDTLFIDEGFGTLDEESLNQAIEILLDLNNDNKSIGIISHVQELKDLIPTKLIVTKNDSGSSVKIVS